MIALPRTARRHQSMPCDLGRGHFSGKRPFRRPPAVRFRQVSQAAGDRDCVKTRERYVAVGTQRYSRSTFRKVWWYAYHGDNYITGVWKN